MTARFRERLEISGKGGGVHRQGREHREDPLLEDLDQVVAVVGIQRIPVAQPDAGLGQLGAHVGQEGLGLGLEEVLDLVPDGPELLARAAPVGPGGGDPRLDLVLQPRHLDLEELVHELAEDGKELHPLEQGHALVLGQLQDPAVEVEPGQLPVQVLGLPLA
jgi:hypothetical protein